MPEPLWISRMVLLYFTRILTCATLTDMLSDASEGGVELQGFLRVRASGWSGGESRGARGGTRSVEKTRVKSGFVFPRTGSQRSDSLHVATWPGPYRRPF